MLPANLAAPVVRLVTSAMRHSFTNEMLLDKRFAFPLALLALNIGAAIVSFITGDWRKGVYWLASAICVGTVAFS